MAPMQPPTTPPGHERDLPTDLVDRRALETWMDSRGLGGGLITDARPISGGTQNVMLEFTRGTRRFVLRRGPAHLRPTTNEALRRETHVLSALAGTGVPHPRIIAACSDPSVLGGSVFYLMEPVDGFNATTMLPELHATNPAVRHRMGLMMVDALAALSAVDHQAVGLSDFGRPDGFLNRQVSRWLKELDSYRRYREYPGPDLPGLQTIAAWLRSNQPSTWTPGIMHGDFHLANVMFTPDGPQVAAIVDWEMCTIGDPLLDVGWLLATWPMPNPHADTTDTPLPGALTEAGGLATPAELISRYATRSDRDLSALTWYTVLACFKLGIVLEGTYARAFGGAAPRSVGDRLHQSAVLVFHRAGALIAGTLTL
jgi:aminoglycoside phosphotransferase (APT) family kinase protein